MSVRAYIVREDIIWVDKENKTFYDRYEDDKDLIRYAHKSEEFCFNFWAQDDFAEIIRDYCCYDGTNIESSGIMEMEIEAFEKMLSENDFTDAEDLDSIETMKRYFNEGYYLITFNCY